jgi:hypothetical protein
VERIMKYMKHFKGKGAGFTTLGTSGQATELFRLQLGNISKNKIGFFQR